MEKKEYQSPKMEVVEMPAFGSLLASSDKKSLRVFINSESCSDCDDDDY